MLSMNSYTQAALERAGWAAAADTTFCRCAERLRRIAVAKFSSHEQSMVAAAGSDPVRRVRAHGRPPGRSKLRPKMPGSRHRTLRLFSCSVKSEGEGSAQPGRSGLNASAAASIVDVICQRRVRRTGTRAENRSGPGTNILRRFVCSAEVRKSILESCSRLLLARVAFLLAHLARWLRL